MSKSFFTNDKLLKEELTKRLLALEEYLKADVISFSGAISEVFERKVLGVIEDLSKDKAKKDTIYVILTTPGGSAMAVERYVNILRHHYKIVNFIVPDYAYSAGTIFCMSGDNIFMDYYSVLGPIDPQVQNKEGRWVAALGYLDKINELLAKAELDKLSNAEFIILKEFDLAELRGYEQARDLTVDLLKKWLVKYKFKNWEKHETTPNLIGTDVTVAQKEARAEEVAMKLGHTSTWKSHGRPINMDTLREMKLKIEDFSKEDEFKTLVRSYYDFLSDFLTKLPDGGNFLHTRIYI